MVGVSVRNPTESAASSARTVEHLVVTQRGTELYMAGEAQPILIVGIKPNHGQAVSWRAAMRQIYRIDIDFSVGTAHCTIHGTGHRTPVSRPISVGAGLGLAEDGVVLSVRNRY